MRRKGPRDRRRCRAFPQPLRICPLCAFHVQVDYQRYSVPYKLIGKRVDARVSQSDVTIYYGHEVVAKHKRLRGRRGQFSTVVEHMPENHRAVGDDLWSPERFLRWAASVGPECKQAIERLMSRHPIVQQSFTACLNILNLTKKYGKEALERACALSNELGTYPTYQGLKRTIESQKAADTAERAKGVAPAPKKPQRQAPKGRAAGAGEYARSKGGDA